MHSLCKPVHLRHWVHVLCSYRTMLPDGSRNMSYLQPDCEYNATDLSSVKIRLGE